MRKTLLGAAAIALAAIGLTAAATAQQAPALYPGEVIREAAGFPAVTWFAKGDTAKPLIVFVPGAHHAARVAYGGHEGARSEDFLAHHLVDAGYSVLAISYPIALAHGGLETSHPDFMIRDWGAQTATIAKETMEAEGLSSAIVLGWSMAGKIAQSVHEAMQDAGVDLEFYVSLAATPALPGMIAITREYPMLESGYADRRKNFDGWFRQVAAQGEAAGREIVPEDVFKSAYQGDIPINLQGYGQQFRDGTFVMDRIAAMEDAKPFHFDNYPLVGAIIPNGRADKRHAIVDQAAWGLYNANTLYKRYMADVDVAALPDESWSELTALADDLDERLSRRVDGNHFFFMGEAGAKATAEAVAELQAEIDTVKTELSELLGKPVD